MTHNDSCAELREAVLTQARGPGCTCPVCGRLVKVYRRKLHNEMARFLIKLVHHYKQFPRFYGMREIFPGNNKSASDGSYLMHWGLIEKSQANNESGAPAGYYRPTDKGLKFVHMVEAVPSHVYLLNNKEIGFSERLITIKQALGSKFNYDELMRG